VEQGESFVIIFLIALVPALGVFPAAVITENRGEITAAALIAAAVRVFTGFLFHLSKTTK
jgi:hypothetical protein